MEICKIAVFKFFLIGLCTIAICGCSQQNMDRQIKADITVKAKEDLNFAGVKFTVSKGVVTLWGTCPTIYARNMVKQKLSTIHVIKNVYDHLKIEPVLIRSSLRTKQQVDSVLADYPLVTADVSDSGVVLNGKIEIMEVSKLLSSVKKVNTSMPTFNHLSTVNKL